MSDTHPRRRREAAAAGAAAALAAGAYALAAAVHGALPGTGSAPAGVRDVAVPFQTHLWDLAHGSTPGDLLFNWNSGYGAPFLPDFFAYLANPFCWPAVLLPRSAVGLSVLLTTLLGIAAAGALMTHALGRLHPGPARLRALLAIGYALCAWVLDEGVANPARLWGLVSLPLLLLAADWCLHERRWAAGTLCVAAAWAGNLHTAAAATLAAGLVLLIRLAASGRAPRRTTRAAPALRTWARVLGRAVTMTATGVLIAAPVLFVALRATQDAQPALLTSVAGELPGPLDRFARLLPGAPAAPALPDVAVGMLGLLLAAGLPFNARVRARERIAWCVLPALAGLVLASRPDVLRWHGLVLPVAGPYRAGFVLSGLLVLAAWVCLSHRPGPPALLGGAGLVLLLAALAHGRPALRSAGWPSTVAALAVATAALWALERLHAHPRATALVTLALACTVVGGAVRSAYPAGGSAQAGGPDRSAVGAAHRALRAADDWSRSRADPGPHAFTANDPLLLGGQGGGYASEQLPAATAQALHDLGMGWTLAGRRTLSPDDPVGRALFGVGARLDDGPAPDGFTLRHSAAPPLVTVHPAGPPDTASVWSRREALLGGPVYDVPVPDPVGGPAPTPHGSSGWSVPATPPGTAGTVLAGTCTPGGTAYFHSLWFDGTVSGLGTTYRSAGLQPVTAVGVRLLGPVPADGRVEVVLRASTTTPVPARPLGCLRPGALEAAVARLTAAGGAAVTAGGHTLGAVLPAGSAGTAVLSVPAVRGWACSSGGPYAAPRPVLGLVGVPLGAGATRVTCSYRVPGLAAGTVVGLASAGVVALVAAVRRHRRRPTATARATRRAATGGAPVPRDGTGGPAPSA